LVARHLAKSRAPRAQSAASGHRSSAPSRVPDFDRLIHERVRLGIISALAGTDSLSFNDLKRLLKTTDGNLSVHARKLEEADYVVCHKHFENRTPRTDYRITAKGRAAFQRYLDDMEQLIRAARE
jgi:DNA-binding HxlR family transcriptional regulator